MNWRAVWIIPMKVCFVFHDLHVWSMDGCIYVMFYVCRHVFISQKAYQETETRPESSVYTEMRGVAMLGDSVQDTTEYVRPSEGGDVISTILRREVTHDQTQGTCAEHYSVANANCTKDSDCTQGEMDFDGHGGVYFYNKYIHIYKLISILLYFKINHSVDPSECIPTYSFRRLDMRKNLPSSGYYNRFAKYHHKDGVEYRTLIKAYGIRLDVIVHGHVRPYRKHISHMLTAHTCSIICDWIMLTFIDKNEVFSEKKFDDVSQEGWRIIFYGNLFTPQDKKGFSKSQFFFSLYLAILRKRPQLPLILFKINKSDLLDLKLDLLDKCYI
uniref:Purinergic receptor P2X, ligand-gated ion channel, 2 n=1 Tax=Sinocyclocheilus grahami TaxID=75366 RepID=A0A672RE52_SINGR